MPLSRRTSHPALFSALLALSFACLRCSSAAVDTGAANAGSPSHAGAHAGAGTSGHNEAGGHSDGGASGADPNSQGGAGPEATAGQAGAGEAPTDDIPSFNGCTAADYEDQSAADAARIIEIAAQGLSYTPPCLTIAAGQTVRFQGSLTSHPLAPGNPDHTDAGSADNPIQATSSGQSVEFEFPTPGTFPYFCELHAFGNGQGMAGVVHVKP